MRLGLNETEQEAASKGGARFEMYGDRSGAAALPVWAHCGFVALPADQRAPSATRLWLLVADSPGARATVLEEIALAEGGITARWTATDRASHDPLPPPGASWGGAVCLYPPDRPVHEAGDQNFEGGLCLRGCGQGCALLRSLGAFSDPISPTYTHQSDTFRV